MIWSDSAPVCVFGAKFVSCNLRPGHSFRRQFLAGSGCCSLCRCDLKQSVSVTECVELFDPVNFEPRPSVSLRIQLHKLNSLIGNRSQK